MKTISNYLQDQLDILTKLSRKDDHSEFVRVYSSGHPCIRKLWLDFRIVKEKQHETNTLKIFNRGHQIEEEIINKLRKLKGIIILETQAIYKKGWAEGHSDVVILWNDKKYLVEIKTANKNSFSKTIREGLVKSKPEHYIQIQVYLEMSEIESAIYFVHCKDNEEIYIEEVQRNSDFGKSYLEKLNSIAYMQNAPEKMNENTYMCKGGMGYKECDYFSICHKTEGINQSCRTCLNLEFKKDVTVFCNKKEKLIKFRASNGEYIQTFPQKAGRSCSDYEMIKNIQNDNEETEKVTKAFKTEFGNNVREFRK